MSQSATCPVSSRTTCYRRCRRTWTPSWCRRTRCRGYRGATTSCWGRRCRSRCRTPRPPAATPCPSAPANNTTAVRNAFSVSARDGPDAEGRWRATRRVSRIKDFGARETRWPISLSRTSSRLHELRTAL